MSLSRTAHNSLNLSETSLSDLADKMVSLVRDSSHNVDTLNEAVDVLAQLGDRAVDKLTPLLSHPKSEVRIAGSLLLGRSGAANAAAPLLKALTDPDPNVIYHSVEGLGRLQTRESIPHLVKLLQSDDFFLSFAVLESLGQIGHPSVLPEVVALCDDDILGEQALVCLGRLGHPAGLAKVVSAMGREDLALQSLVIAVELIAQWCEEHGIDPERLKSLVSAQLCDQGRVALTREGLKADVDSPPEYWQGLVRLHGWIATLDSDELLMDLLQNPSTGDICANHYPIDAVSSSVLEWGRSHWELSVKVRITKLLGRMNRHRSTAILIDLIDESRDEEVTRAAAVALARVAGETESDAIFHRLVHPDSRVRQSLLGYLERHPARDHTVFQALLSSQHPEVRSAAARSSKENYWELLLERAKLEKDDTVLSDLIENLALVEPAHRALTDWLVLHWPSSSPAIRAAGARILSRLPAEDGLNILSLALADDNFWVKLYACRSAEDSTELLEAVDIDTLLVDPLPPVRAAAASLLAKLGAADRLEPLLQDGEPDVVRATIAALGQSEVGRQRLAERFDKIDSGYQKSILLALSGSSLAAVVDLAKEAFLIESLRACAWQVLWAATSEQAAVAVADILLDSRLHPKALQLSRGERMLPNLDDLMKVRCHSDFPSQLRLLHGLEYTGLIPDTDLGFECSAEDLAWLRRTHVLLFWQARHRLPTLTQAIDLDQGLSALIGLLGPLESTLP